MHEFNLQRLLKNNSWINAMWMNL